MSLDWAPPNAHITEKQGALLGSREVPLEACPGLATPAISNTPRITVRRILPSANGTASASRSDQFRSSLLTAYLLAVYASHPPVTRRMATLATGLPATALTGLDSHQLDFNKEFHCLITVPPFPRLAQRDPIVAETRLNRGNPRLVIRNTISQKKSPGIARMHWATFHVAHCVARY